jgi:hypothetical protein
MKPKISQKELVSEILRRVLNSKSPQHENLPIRPTEDGIDVARIAKACGGRLGINLYGAGEGTQTLGLRLGNPRQALSGLFRKF